jgi:hypothetical protein
MALWLAGESKKVGELLHPELSLSIINFSIFHRRFETKQLRTVAELDMISR